MRFIFVFVLFITVACNPKPKGGTSGTHATTPTGGTTSSAPVLVRVHGSTEMVDPSQVDDSQTEEEHVHVYKYSGKIQCYPLIAISLSEMESQLTNLGIPVHNRFTAQDGEEYDNGCHRQTGEMNVYVIDKSHLQISESRGGFCECTPDSSRPGVCVPYVYQSTPANGCKGIVTQ